MKHLTKIPAVLAVLALAALAVPAGAQIEVANADLEISASGEVFIDGKRVPPKRIRVGASEGVAINEKRAVSATARITVENTSGVIEVQAWNRNEVEITGTLGKGSEGLSLVGGGDRLDIKVELPERSRNVESSELFLKVPEGARVVLEGVSSDLRVMGTRGAVRLSSVSGNVYVEGPMQDVRAESVSGDVRVAAASTLTRLESVSGDIDVTRASGVLRAESVSGDVNISVGRVREFSAESVSGDLELKLGGLEPEAEVRVDSVSGDIELELPAGADTELSLETYSGELRSDFGKPDASEPERLLTTLGKGNGMVHIESHSGDIRVRRR